MMIGVPDRASSVKFRARFLRVTGARCLSPCGMYTTAIFLFFLTVSMTYFVGNQESYSSGCFWVRFNDILVAFEHRIVGRVIMVFPCFC